MCLGRHSSGWLSILLVTCSEFVSKFVLSLFMCRPTFILFSLSDFVIIFRYGGLFWNKTILVYRSQIVGGSVLHLICWDRITYRYFLLFIFTCLWILFLFGGWMWIEFLVEYLYILLIFVSLDDACFFLFSFGIHSLLDSRCFVSAFLLLLFLL